VRRTAQTAEAIVPDGWCSPQDRHYPCRPWPARPRRTPDQDPASHGAQPHHQGSKAQTGRSRPASERATAEGFSAGKLSIGWLSVEKLMDFIIALGRDVVIVMRSRRGGKEATGCLNLVRSRQLNREQIRHQTHELRRKRFCHAAISAQFRPRFVRILASAGPTPSCWNAITLIGRSEACSSMCLIAVEKLGVRSVR
jgi:hypothetical protein